MAVVSYPDLTAKPGTPQDFSLVLGGPLFQLLRRTRMSGDALELVRNRMLTMVSITWVPLLLLSFLEGQALHGIAVVPFLFDVEAHVRFLVALPLLIVAELVVHRRMRPVVRQFVNRGLIEPAAQPRFDAAIASAVRLRNSAASEAALIGFVYLVGVTAIWRHFIALSTTATWYAVPTAGGMQLTWTGLWYAYVSLPIFQFLLVRWYYRIFIWVRFLWQVSRIELTLVPTHPDRVCGLGFLAQMAYAFTPLAVAHGAMLAGPIANRIFYVGAQLPEFKIDLLVLIVFVLCVVFGPFLVFAPQLAAAKRRGLGEYGTLAERYVREFEAKWLRGGASRDEPFVGSGDIQSLADLSNSFDVVKTTRIAPITRDGVLRLAVATAAPVAPLLLTMMSPEQLVNKLLALLF